MDEYTENTANTRTEENMTAGYGAQEEKNDGVMQEEPAAAYTDYYADGTSVIRTNGTQPVYGQNAGRTEQTDPMPAYTQSTQPQSRPDPVSGYTQNPRPDRQPQYQSYHFDEEWSRRQVDPQPMQRKKNGGDGSFLKKLLLSAAVAVVFGVIAGLCFLGVTALGRASLKNSFAEEHGSEVVPAPTEAPKVTAGTSENVPQAVITPSDQVTGSVADVAESSMPALVSITNLSTQQYYSFFGQSGTYENESAGSGIIVGETDTELLIATNDHVIADADTLTICFVDGEAVPGVVKGADHVNDLAIVAVAIEDIPEETLTKIRIIPIGDSDALRIGDQVVAIGNALGFGQSVSGGYVSALNRTVVVEGEEHVLLQTDAAINPGNSGGALLNMQGELIGINEVKYVAEDTEGIGYAIPISFAKPILDELMNKETRRRVAEEDSGYLGIKCITVTEQYSQALNIPVGAYVDSVEQGGAAEKAGIRARDIITAIDGYAVTSTTDLLGELRYYAAGETIPVTVARLGSNNEYEEIELTITLGKRPAENKAED